MAAVSIPPSPQTFSMMSSRRIPLAHVPNAANSPFRAVAAAASKRSRSHSSVQRELPYGQAPPAKKQMIERDESSLRTPPRRPLLPDPERKIFARKSTAGLPTEFARRLVEAKEAREQQQYDARHDKVVIENLEHIRQWRKHYRKVFPQYVFYFESISDDMRYKLSKQLASLGAREEKFFSKTVTHVVTTRPLPPDDVATKPTASMPPPSTSVGSQSADQSRNINPSMLETSADNLQTQGLAFPPRSKFTFESQPARVTETTHAHPITETRKQVANADILLRAKEMGMKIWALEKLQRILITMFDTNDTIQYPDYNLRGNAVAANRADLSTLLHNERLTGPSDRGSAVAAMEIVPFRGPYIYVHDMDEVTKPIMVREYPKASHREDGEWPQFHSTTVGKCPFVEDMAGSKAELAQERAKERQMLVKRERESQSAPRTRAATTAEATGTQERKLDHQDRSLTQSQGNLNRISKPEENATNGLFEIPKMVPAKRGSPGKALKCMSTAFDRPRPYGGGEPIASGVQPSNITSAIRSQMISSTAAAPGAKAGTSKEVHELKRKVLEKNAGPSLNGITKARVTEITRVAIGTRSISAVGTATRKVQVKMGHIEEEGQPSEEEMNSKELEHARKSSAARNRKIEKRSLKPGYCENCQEKFEDFEHHTITRKHRKFALNNENWAELDDLLKDLARPLREE